jgi:hypothetical protein
MIHDTYICLHSSYSRFNEHGFQELQSMPTVTICSCEPGPTKDDICTAGSFFSKGTVYKSDRH